MITQIRRTHGYVAVHDFSFTMEFYKGIIEMTIKWSFSCNSFVKIALIETRFTYNSVHPIEQKHSIIKGLNYSFLYPATL